MKGLRRTVALLHRWAGLSIGLLLIFVAITGALLAYRPHLDAWAAGPLARATTCEHDVPLDALVSAARTVHPRGTLDTVRVFRTFDAAEARLSAQVRFRGQDFQDTIYLDPCNGSVLGFRPRFGGVFGTIEQLHRFRFGPLPEWLSGALALTLIAMVVGGVYLWWPRGGRTLARSTRFDARLQGRARTFDHHRVIGLYVGAIVVLSALTGLPQAFDWSANVLYRLIGSPLPSSKPRSVSLDVGTALGTTRLYEKAVAVVPDARDLTMRLGRDPADAVEVVAIRRDAPHANARTMLYLDAHDGHVLGFTPYEDASAGTKAFLWTLSWHTGEIGGLVGPLILIVGALGLAFLGYSGITSYLRRRLAVP
jgi:uncharacterized iron-regulated membrane protein